MDCNENVSYHIKTGSISGVLQDDQWNYSLIALTYELKLPGGAVHLAAAAQLQKVFPSLKLKLLRDNSAT